MVAYGFTSGVWTCPMVARVIDEEFSVSYHPAHVSRILHELKFSVQRPKKTLAQADKTHRSLQPPRVFSPVQCIREDMASHTSSRHTQTILCIPGRASLCLDFNVSEHPEKTVSGYGVSTFNFLGFTYYCGKTRKGTFRVGRKTNPKKMRAKLKAMNQWLKSIRNAIEFKEWWPILKQKLIGHYRYYGISGNMKGIRIYYSQSVKLAYKWVNRRSQKKRFNWEKYRRLIYEWIPLPQPKIYHLTYNSRLFILPNPVTFRLMPCRFISADGGFGVKDNALIHPT